MKYKRRKKSERNALAPFPKVETSRKVIEWDCANTYWYRPILKRPRCCVVRKDGMISLNFIRRIERIRGE